MPIHTLRQFDETSAGVTLPKDDLRQEGIIDPETGEIQKKPNLSIRRVDSGRWEVIRLDENYQPATSE